MHKETEQPKTVPAKDKKCKTTTDSHNEISNEKKKLSGNQLCSYIGYVSPIKECKLIL